MKTKSISTQVFEVRLWSKKHYGFKATKGTNIWSGLVTNAKTKKKYFFDDAGELLTYIRKMYLKAEKHK